MQPTSRRCPGPISRRQFMQLGSLAFASTAVPAVAPWRLQAAPAKSTPSEEPAVILIWLPGGPPHTETYDLKPDAPAEYRGAFRPIRTNVSGIQVCEHLPMHAKIADKFSLIRSVAHTFSDHGGGHKRFLTGRDPLSPVGFVNDYPMVGSMVAKLKGDRGLGIPNYIAGVDNGRQGIDVFSFGAAYLGPATYPFMVVGDPSDPAFRVQNLDVAPQIAERIHERIGLLRQLEKTSATDPAEVFRKQAVELLTANVAKKAFDLANEPAKVRERYGYHRYGQRALLARRLVEAGSQFVTMVWENPTRYKEAMPKDVTYNWDSHAVNCNIFTDGEYRLPPYDRALTALIEDLYDRGLDRRVLVIATGEFGRTPKIEYSNGRPGRDHWPQAMSILISGGGLKMGQVVGSTTAKGEYPKDRPLSPNDLWATMFRHLGIDWRHTAFPDAVGRPMPILPYGEPIKELI